MEYKPGSGNIVADTLSRKMEFATISQPNSPLLERIQEGLSHDSTAKNLRGKNEAILARGRITIHSRTTSICAPTWELTKGSHEGMS